MCVSSLECMYNGGRVCEFISSNRIDNRPLHDGNALVSKHSGVRNRGGCVWGVNIHTPVRWWVQVSVWIYNVCAHIEGVYAQWWPRVWGGEGM